MRHATAIDGRDFATLDDLLCGGAGDGARCLLRVDLNVPMDGGAVRDATRFERIVPTIGRLRAAGFRIGLLSHFGRPGGRPDPSLSLEPVARALARHLSLPVPFLGDCAGAQGGKALAALPRGGVGVFENTRFHAGESANDAAFARRLAANGDVYVNDAFSASHRAHASIVALARLLPCHVGDAMLGELESLRGLLGELRRPAVAIVGGAKLTGKLALLEALVQRFDALILGGGMANLFLAARGVEVGASLAERARIEDARAVEGLARASGCRLLAPRDAVVARECAPHAAHRVVDLQDKAGGVGRDERILDVGAESLRVMAAYFETAATVVWNGPLGVFETPPFDQGGETAARHVAMLTKIGALTSVAGGGETAMLLEQAGATRDFSHVSTGGGAFLRWLEGGDLPGLEAARAAWAKAGTAKEGKT